jgi:hypothetical protein
MLVGGRCRRKTKYAVRIGWWCRLDGPVDHDALSEQFDIDRVRVGHPRKLSRSFRGHSRTLAQATPPILRRMKSAWLNLRRSRYFIGPYSDTPDITIMGPPPYFVLSEECPPDELGRTIRVALDASLDEIVSRDDAVRLAEDRTLELARRAGVKDRRTFERGARLVHFDCVSVDEILITPSFRKRGYWDPLPKAQWLSVRRPSDSELGDAAVRAVARSTA